MSLIVYIFVVLYENIRYNKISGYKRIFDITKSVVAEEYLTLQNQWLQKNIRHNKISKITKHRSDQNQDQNYKGVFRL